MVSCPNFWVCACTDRSVEGSTPDPCSSCRSAGCHVGLQLAPKANRRISPASNRGRVRPELGADRWALEPIRTNHPQKDHFQFATKTSRLRGDIQHRGSSVKRSITASVLPQQPRQAERTRDAVHVAVKHQGQERSNYLPDQHQALCLWPGLLSSIYLVPQSRAQDRCFQRSFLFGSKSPPSPTNTNTPSVNPSTETPKVHVCQGPDPRTRPPLAHRLNPDTQILT